MIDNCPKISVIIPIYNTDKFIRHCLDSIISQTYYNFEVIIVDDGSTDQSGTISDEYALKDNRFKVIHQENQGVSMARIAAFEYCKGDYITFIDSDDYVSTDYLEKLAKPFIEEEADIVSCNYSRVKNQNTYYNDIFVTGRFQGKTLRNFILNHFFYNEQTKNYGIHPGLATKMVKRDIVLEGLQMGRGLWYGEDTIAFFYMMLRCNKLVALSDRLYYYVEHDDEAVKKYNTGLWADIIELLQRLENICHKEGNIIYGIRSRIWNYIIDSIHKMQMSGMTYMEFYKDINVVRNYPYMVKYFEPWLINNNNNIKDNVIYILFRFKKYHLYWILRKFRNMI